MPSDLVIRAATVEDRAAVTRLLTAQMRDHEFKIDDDGIARGVELALMASSSAWLLIALRSGLPAGVLLANPLVSVEKGGIALWIEELYVAPPHRRRGIARALLEHVAAEAKSHGVRAIDLEVDPTHEAAMALYPSAGYRLVDRRRFGMDLY